MLVFFNVLLFINYKSEGEGWGREERCVEKVREWNERGKREIGKNEKGLEGEEMMEFYKWKGW